MSPNALAHLRQAKTDFGCLKFWITSSSPQAIVKCVMAAALPCKRKSLLARGCEKAGMWGDLTTSPGITTPLMRGTNRPTNEHIHESVVLYTSGEGHPSQWKSSDPVTYNLKYRNSPESGDRMTTMYPPGLQVCKSWNQQNIVLHVKPIPMLVITQQGEDSSTADKSSLPTALAAQAFIQQNIQKRT